MKGKFYLLLLVFFCVKGASGQGLAEKSLTSELAALGFSAPKINSMLLDGNNVWMVPGSSWNTFRFLKDQKGILLWDGTKLHHFCEIKWNINTDSVFRMKKADGKILALTAKGIKYFKGDTFYSHPWNNGVSAQTIYDVLPFGSKVYIGTNKGLFIRKGNTVTQVTTSNGLQSNVCVKLVSIKGKVFVLTDAGVSEYDTTQSTVKNINAGFSPSYPDMAAFGSYLCVSRLGKATDSLPNSLGFYKDGKFLSINAMVSGCDYRKIPMYGELMRRLESDGSNLMLFTIGDFNAAGVGFMSVGKANVYENLDSLAPACGTIDQDWVADFVSADNVLKVGKRSVMEEFYKSLYKTETLETNNLGFGVGTSNNNNGFDNAGLRIKSRDCRSLLQYRSLCLAALDADDSLYVSATTYAALGSDFCPGPLTFEGQTNDSLQKKYNRVWRVTRQEIENHIAEFNLNGKVVNVVKSIAEWPAVEHYNSEHLKMAPWVDLNHNGYYEPDKGDFPLIRGDEAIFFVFNDSVKHARSKGKPLKVQVNGLAWSAHCPEWNKNDSFHLLENTVFVDYEVVNRSGINYKSLYSGFAQQMDLGYGGDDLNGCLPKYNVAFQYNADSSDEGTSGFGINPPVQNIMMLEGPEASSDGLDNDNDGVVDNSGEQCLMGSMSLIIPYNDPKLGHPFLAPEFYNYLQGKFRNGESMVYHGDTVKYLFSHGEDPAHPLIQWTQRDTGNLSIGDPDVLLSSGPVEFKDGQSVRYTIAFNYMDKPYQSNPASQVKAATILLNQVYKNETWKSCSNAWVNTEEIKPKGKLNIYPVPTQGELAISLGGFNGMARYSLIDITGRQASSANLNFSDGLASVNIHSLSDGIYILTVKAGENTFSVKLIKN